MTCSLVIHKEETELRIRPERATKAAAKNVLLHDRARLTLPLQEIFIRVELVVPKELKSIAVKTLRTALQNCIDIPAAVAALAGIIE